MKSSLSKRSSLFSAILFLSQFLFAQRFAVIGDYGYDLDTNEKKVAALVKSWKPDFIITVGDNNYPNGEDTMIDRNIGKYYHAYIDPYYGIYEPYDSAGKINRFFPSFGNHDWNSLNGQPYLSFFTLPNNERYYTLLWGNVQLIALNSDTTHEPDGWTQSSLQAFWCKGVLAGSGAPWKLCYFHHPPYSSDSTHGNTAWMQWPFQAWGATAVLSGHAHDYERSIIGNIPYYVNGLGGKSRYLFKATVPPTSIKRYNANFGAMLVNAYADSICFEFRNIKDSLIDKYCMLPSFGIPEHLNAIGCSIFPNPFSSSATIFITNFQLLSGNTELGLFDVLGRPVRTIPIKSQQQNLDKENLAAGMYLWKLKNGNSLLAKGKLVIQ